MNVPPEDLPGISRLREFVKLNVSDDCYKAYESLIEPGIRTIIENYFRNWQDIESVVTRMVMVHKKIYKTSLQFLSLPNDAKEKFGDQVDVDEFNKVKFGMSFKNKLDYLNKVRILPINSYNLLSMLNKRRNDIHEVGTVFTQQDLDIFAGAHSVVFYLLLTLTDSGFNEEQKRHTIENAEIWAQNLISVIENNKTVSNQL